MGEWNNAINNVMNSKDVGGNINSSSVVYVGYLSLTNNTTCVTGQETDCEFKGYNLNKSSFSQLINQDFITEPKDLYWQQPDVITFDTYNTNGNYDQDGQIKIVDYGPGNLDQLIKKLS
jgi:hypothetical protein